MLLAKMDIWLTPFWLVCTGFTLAAIVLAAVYGICHLAWRPFSLKFRSFFTEGVMLPLSILSAVLIVLSVVAAFTVPSRDLLVSAFQLPFDSTFKETLHVENDGQRQIVTLPDKIYHLRELHVVADQPVAIAFAADEDDRFTTPHTFKIKTDEKKSWTKQQYQRNPLLGRFTVMAIQNTGIHVANVTITAESGAKFGEASTIWYTMITILVGFTLHFVGSLLLPKHYAIAMTTAKEAIAQPLFVLLAIGGAVMLAGFVYIPYNTFGEDIKMVKENGPTLIMVLSIIIALWTASATISDELEGRTALTLLSKPVTRRQFVVGKFMGVGSAAALLFTILGVFFLLVVSFKTNYDARENSSLGQLTWQLCHIEMISVVPALILGLMETILLVSISVAISTRLPMMPNLIICTVVYVLGHLVPLLVQSSQGQFPIVTFIGQLLAAILPVLDHFKVPGAILGDSEVGAGYLLVAGGYTLLYSLIAMCFALYLFEDRDLA